MRRRWRLPDAFEINDALETVKQLGGTVARIVRPLHARVVPSGITRFALVPGGNKRETERVPSASLTTELCAIWGGEFEPKAMGLAMVHKFVREPKIRARVSNIVELGWWDLADPTTWPYQRERLVGKRQTQGAGQGEELLDDGDDFVVSQALDGLTRADMLLAVLLVKVICSVVALTVISAWALSGTPPAPSVGEVPV